MRFLRRWLGAWPSCPHCKQSMTGVYNGRPSCIRCSNGRWLTAEHPLKKL